MTKTFKFIKTVLKILVVLQSIFLITNVCFTDCGESKNVPNANKSVDKSFEIDSETSVELKVSYSCQLPFLLVPETANTVHSCITGGNWTQGDDFKCLRGILKLVVWNKSSLR